MEQPAKKSYQPIEHVNPEIPCSVDRDKPRHIVFAKYLRFNFPSRDDEITDLEVSEIESYITEQELYMPIINIPEGSNFQAKLMSHNGITFRNWWRDRALQPKAVLIWDASLPECEELVVYTPALPFVNFETKCQEKDESDQADANKPGNVSRS